MSALIRARRVAAARRLIEDGRERTALWAWIASRVPAECYRDYLRHLHR